MGLLEPFQAILKLFALLLRVLSITRVYHSVGMLVIAFARAMTTLPNGFVFSLLELHFETLIRIFAIRPCV